MTESEFLRSMFKRLSDAHLLALNANPKNSEAGAYIQSHIYAIEYMIKDYLLMRRTEARNNE